MAEILKADAGILDSDPRRRSSDKATSASGGRRRSDADADGTSDVLLSAIGIDAGSDPLAGARPGRRRPRDRGRLAPVLRVSSRGRTGGRAHRGHPLGGRRRARPLEALSTRTVGTLVLLCTARPELWELRPSWGAGVRDATVIDLPPLSDRRAVAARGIARRTTSGRRRPRDHRASRGNPFFAGELLRMMVEDGTLERVRLGWTRSRDLPSALPDTVQGAIASRIDLLAPARSGRSRTPRSWVARSGWARVARSVVPTVEAQLDALIDKGSRAQERDASAIAGERELIFHHVLTRDVAYESIPRGRRREAHGTSSTGWRAATTRPRRRVRRDPRPSRHARR